MAGEDVHEEAIHEEDDLHETETDFDLVDLDDENDDEASKMIIKKKDAQTNQLQTNLEISQFFITFHEQENEQLKTKQAIMEIQLLKEKREEKKEKALLDEAYERYGETNEAEEKVLRKRALELERKNEVELPNELTLNGKFSLRLEALAKKKEK